MGTTFLLIPWVSFKDDLLKSYSRHVLLFFKDIFGLVLLQFSLSRSILDGQLIQNSFLVWDYLLTHQLRICYLLQGIWLIGTVVLGVSREGLRSFEASACHAG